MCHLKFCLNKIVYRFWDQIDRYPPCLVRLLARVPRGRPLTNSEIAEKSGLSEGQIVSLSHCTDWAGVDIYALKAFSQACGVDLFNSKDMRRVTDYIRKRPSFRYLKVSSEWDIFYKPLVLKWVTHYESAKGGTGGGGGEEQADKVGTARQGKSSG